MSTELKQPKQWMVCWEVGSSRDGVYCGGTHGFDTVRAHTKDLAKLAFAVTHPTHAGLITRVGPPIQIVIK